MVVFDLLFARDDAMDTVEELNGTYFYNGSLILVQMSYFSGL